ncbi:MAG: hypothetical protein HYZ57_07640 [Acidobacteria bacterium]|nr:hypothetical protein [Acidobacteriota bacterium]MBI3279695.1 hypothetical protein [Acidobacteriota bacterium]
MEGRRQEVVCFCEVGLHPNNPLKYVDPDGDVPIPVITGLVGAGVGGLVGAGAEALKQWRAGGEIKWGKVWTAAGGGAIAGGLAGLTLGVGAGVGVAVTIPEAVGGIAERQANEWLGYDPPNDAGTELANMGIEAATGAVGGFIGGKVADALVPIPNVQRQIRQVRFSHRRSTRAVRTAAAISAAERQAFINSGFSGFVGGAKSEIGEFLLCWWFLNSTQRPREERQTARGR